MRFAVIREGPPLTSEALSAYCADHGLVLPEPLRLQLIEQNGAVPEATLLVSVAGQDEELDSFLGVGMDDLANELAWNADTLKGRLPDGLLPFANDPGGNLFVVETDPASTHGVLFWDHELEGDSAALTPIAPTFTEFLGMLREEPDF